MLFTLLLACIADKESPSEELPPSISVDGNAPSLTELAIEAIAMTPTWLQRDLRLSLHKLDATLQNDLALLIVDINDSYLIDEVAFSIAHLSPEILASDDFYPQLLIENAESIYERDEVLDYVIIEDYGVPGENPDYYTTAAYRVEDLDGTVTQSRIDKDIYYWYVVHPRMEDELPLYIDPWTPCGSAECPSTPENGQFWRTFLWEGAQYTCPEGEECPVIRDYLVDTDIDVLWKSKEYNSSDNGAIGALIKWEKASMRFGAGDERPIQPNRIYAVGCGNCGEWADMATAAARSALIPSHNVGARANDHTWNEFWDDGWQQWEPVNNYVLHWYYYQNREGETSGSNAVYAITSSRGDGYVSTERTVDYGNTFTLDVTVTDNNGTGIDGALVTLYGPILVYDVDGYWYAAESYTNADGVAQFTLGEKNQFLYRVDSSLGSDPVQDGYINRFLNTANAGDHHELDITIDATAPSTGWTEEPASEGDLQLSFSTSLEHRLSADSWSLRGTFSKEVDTSKLDRFLVTKDNYDLFVDGQDFVAHHLAEQVASETVSFSLDEEEEWYLVLSNDRSLGISSVGEIDISLSSTDNLWAPVSFSTSVNLLPGEYSAIQITR